MKTAISTACFYSKTETENALTSIKESGVKAISVKLQTFYEYRPEFAQKYAKNAAGAEVCCVETQPLNFERQLFEPSRRVRGDGYYWLEQVLRSAAIFGAKKYVLKAPLVSEENCGYLSEIKNFCAGYGVELCIENNSFGLFRTPADFEKIKKACPEISGSLNLKEAKKANYPYKMYIMAMAGSLARVVVSESDNFEELIPLLKQISFKGEIILDTENFSDISALKSIIANLNSLI